MKAMIRGKEYQIPSLNVGQLERMSPILERSDNLRGIDIFKVCTERAMPTIDASIEATLQDIEAVTDMVLRDCGLIRSADPNEPPAPQGQVAG